jgi:hypothetical protein
VVKKYRAGKFERQPMPGSCEARGTVAFICYSGLMPVLPIQTPLAIQTSDGVKGYANIPICTDLILQQADCPLLAMRRKVFLRKKSPKAERQKGSALDKAENRFGRPFLSPVG